MRRQLNTVRTIDEICSIPLQTFSIRSNRKEKPYKKISSIFTNELNILLPYDDISPSTIFKIKTSSETTLSMEIECLELDEYFV